MTSKKWTRRKVVTTLSMLPLAVNTKTSVIHTIIHGGKSVIPCKVLNFKGEPLETDKMNRFYICDLLSRPFAIHPKFSAGQIVFEPVSTPFRISLPLKVPGFGEVFLYADNGGKGYTAESLSVKNELFLNFEFAADRLFTIQQILKECQTSGIKISQDITNRISSAKNYFDKANAAKPDAKVVTKWCMESLRESLYAGEMLVLARAKHKIENQGPRPGFLFGCNAFRFRDNNNEYARLFKSLFNFATLPFYMGGIQKSPGEFDYSRVDTILEALKNEPIIKKGHPLIFWVPNSTTPDWARYKSYAETKKICLDYIRKSVLKYRGQIHSWDIINEAHVQPDTQYGNALVPGLTKEQTADLSCAAAEAAREADPTCFRVVNNTGTWSDYYMGRKPNPWQQSVYDYLLMLEDAGCEYEAIGLQYYHSGRDLLEFDRDIERFSRFKKPIHVTEVQIPSSSEEIPGKDWWGGGIGGAGFTWHGDAFTEKIQADWTESVYNILYSKSYVDAITWWDMNDPSFIPHGGLVNENLAPKESYHRLKSLLEKWKSSETKF